ncbi:MAG: putative transport system permease protein [Thermoanaerobaculia bacterium]|jgi:putative ABC transport system permease protein|nr:putative transport system permease protein [Thermoanaerobaculia bacterium]
MTTRWKKAFRDFWQESTRTLLVVLAIAVGISGFAAVLGSYAILTRELNQGYLATNPASATLRTDAVDDDLLAAIAATPGVRDAEARRTLSGRIRGTKGWRNLTLFVVKDFAHVRVGKLNPEEGAWPPSTGEILIERDAFQVARIHIGEDVIVRTTNGPEKTLRVSGGVHDVGQAQARMENVVYGYITTTTLALLGETPTLNQVKLVVSGDARSTQHIERVAADVKKTIEGRGHPVTRVDIPTPGKHPHADIMGLLLLSLSSFGLFVLILSGVIVVNLLTALMAAQIRQIGIMKAIGGTRWQIARIYFGQALLLGAAAIAIAIPVGIAGSRALCRAMALFLNFDITSFAIPMWVFLLVAAIGIVVPLLAAAWPVWRGSGVSVREALADYGVASDRFGTSPLDRMLSGVGGLTRPLLLAIRNNFRRRARLVMTVITLAAGGLFFMTALNLRASMINTLDRLFATKKYDLGVTIAGMTPLDEVNRAVRNTPGIRSAEGWIASEGTLPDASHGARAIPHATGGLHGGSGPGAAVDERFIVLAVPANTQMLRPDLAEGEWLRADDRDTLVINGALAAKSPQMRVGNRVTFPMGPGQVSLRITGIARESFSPPTAYMPRAFFDAMPGHGAVTNNVRLVLDKSDPASIDRVKALLEENFTRAGIKAVSMSSKSDSRFGFDQHMLMIYVALIIMSAMIGGVGGLGLMTTMSLNILERRRELGVMRAIGATPRAILLMLVAEGGVVGLASWGLATLAAWPLGNALGDFLIAKMFKSGLDFAFELRGVAVWLAVSLVLGAVASFVPAWETTHSSIREALNYE